MASCFVPTGPQVVKMIKHGELPAHEDKKHLMAKAYTSKLTKIRKALKLEVGLNTSRFGIQKQFREN